MLKKENVISLLLAFLLGILLTLLSLRFNETRYIPFGSEGNQILDTRNGSLYSRSASISGGEGIWLLKVPKIGTE